MSEPLLSVQGLSISFRTRRARVSAVQNLSFEINPGEMLGIVGESGSGKSVTAMSLLGLLDKTAHVTGNARFGGVDLLSLPERELSERRGRDLSILFQNPRTALNPIRRVGEQIADVISRHDPSGAGEIRGRVLAGLRQLRVPDPERRLNAYPFELSGGLCQRVGIAIALACAPKLLIADEPTTGLDVTTQAVIMDLFRDLLRERGVAILLITHDLALAADYCDRILVMHAGHGVETAPVEALFAHPRHPYTARLLASAPSAVDSIDALQPTAGQLPDLSRPDLPFCRFAERCEIHAVACDAPFAADVIGPRQSVFCRTPL